MSTFHTSDHASPEKEQATSGSTAFGSQADHASLQDSPPPRGDQPLKGSEESARFGDSFFPQNPFDRSAYAETPKPIFSGLDTLFAWLSIVVGFLFVRMLPVVQNTLGALLFAWLLFGFAALYLIRSRVIPTPSAIALAALTCLLSLGLITGANQVLQRLLYLFIFCVFLYWIYAVCGLSGGKLLGENCIAHIIHSILVLPMSSVEYIFRALPIRSRKKESNGNLMRTLGWILLGLAVAVVPTAIVVLLLSYDEQFTALLDKIFSFHIDGAWEAIRDVILGFLVAILLFGALFGVKWGRQRHNGGATPLHIGSCHVLPKALLCAAVTPILAVYVIFFISQWDYYISAFTHSLPEELTYAVYARSGFFELCWVCAINACLLLLFNLLIRRTEGEKGRLQAIYSAVISLFTLVLIATALSKMVLYIDSYGLTQKRVYASWLMLLLAAIFVLVLIRQFVKRLPLFSSIAVCCILFFALIVLPNVDGMIASYNVNAYLDGELNEVDVDTAASFGVSSVPALIELRDSLEEKKEGEELSTDEKIVLQKTKAALTGISNGLQERDDTFWSFNIPTARARALLDIKPTENTEQ